METWLFVLGPWVFRCCGLMILAILIVGWQSRMGDWLATGYLQIF